MTQSDFFHGYVAVQGRGTVALPPALRKRYRLDSPGAQVEITERPDGVLELRPALPVPAAEAWFWDPGWHRGEREVDEHARRGEVEQHDDADALLAHLDTVAPE